MQEVKLYFDLLDAKYNMEKYINSGWRIKVCTMSKYMTSEKVLVVYEK